MPQVPLAGFSVSLAHDKTLSSYHLKQAPADMNLMPDLIGDNTLPLHAQAHPYARPPGGEIGGQGEGGELLKIDLILLLPLKETLTNWDLSLMLPWAALLEENSVTKSGWT